MDNDSLIECCQSVLDFLIEDDEEFKNSTGSFTYLPHYKKMIEVINKYEMGDMISFTKFINRKYRIYPDPIFVDGKAKEFFTKNGVSFYKGVLRELKINKILK